MVKKDLFQEVVERLYQFRKKRGWLGLDPADLAKSVVLEAAELLECYQWDNTDRVRREVGLKKDKQKIALEAADVLIYLLDFCHENRIDLLKTALEKINLNEKRYPVPEIKKTGRQAYWEAKKRHRQKKQQTG